MGWRFRKTFKLAPGVRVTLTDRGVTSSVGPRGASVSFGRRGTHLNTSIPGTGLYGRTRLGGGSRSTSAAAPRSGGGALGWLLGGIVGFVIFIAALSSGGGTTPSSAVPLMSASYAPAAAPARALDTLYVHGTLNVRRGPGREYAIVRALHRGDTVLLGPANADGWAEFFPYTGAASEGYIYRASTLVRSSPPRHEAERASSTSASSRSTSRRASGSNVYHRGPRGGCYTYTASGNKRYVDRSYCN